MPNSLPRQRFSAWGIAGLPAALGVYLLWQGEEVVYIGRALGNGVTREEISEVITHLALYSGWPSAMTAAHIACDVFEEQDRKA